MSAHHASCLVRNHRTTYYRLLCSERRHGSDIDIYVIALAEVLCDIYPSSFVVGGLPLIYIYIQRYIIVRQTTRKADVRSLDRNFERPMHEMTIN